LLRDDEKAPFMSSYLHTIICRQYRGLSLAGSGIFGGFGNILKNSRVLEDARQGAIAHWAEKCVKN
jgi:hypothetical protein